MRSRGVDVVAPVVALALVALGACGSQTLESRPRLQPTAAVAPGAPAAPADRALQRVVVATSSPSLSWLPAQLAYKLGYFREEGLDPEFVQVGGTSVVPALLSGEAAFTTVLSAVAANAGQGGTTRIVQFHSSRLQHVLIVRPDITSIQQLAGKRIAVQSLGTLTAHEARKIVEHYNLPDVAILAVGGDLERIAAIESGAADASVAAIPGNLVAERRGLSSLLRISTILEIPQAGYGTTDVHLREQPGLVVNTLRATARALPLVTRQPELVIDSIREWMDLPPEDAARAYEMVADTFSPNGLISEAQMQVYLELLRATAGAPDDISPAQVADFSVARRVAAELGLPGP